VVEDLEATTAVAVVRVPVRVARPVLLAVDAEVERRPGGVGGAGVEAHVLAVARPAEVVVGGAVLHHHHHDVLDVRVLRCRPAERARRDGEVHQLRGVGGAPGPKVGGLAVHSS